MNVQEKPPEVNGNLNPASLDDRHSTPSGAIPDFDQSAILLLESENSGLRRLVVELLEKNQKLREQLIAERAA
jgi:hypothetical protein